MANRICVLGRSLVVVLLLVACKAKTPSQAPALSTQVPSEISAFTHGIVGKNATIRVAFTEPHSEATFLNTPLADSPLVFKPKLDGVAVWTSRDVLEFRPTAPLKSGEHYDATLDLKKASIKNPSAATFAFAFACKRQSLEVTVEGLRQDPDAARHMALQGVLTTADAATNEAVERVITVQHGDDNLTTVWEHDSAKQRHAFTVRGIVRGSAVSQVKLVWTGTSIDSSAEGTQLIDVPARSEFVVTSAQAILSPERCVEVRFSDALLPSQNLSGLVRVQGVNPLRFAVDGSILRIYRPNGQWNGSIELTVDATVKDVDGRKLKEQHTSQISFERPKPQVKFSSNGVFVPQIDAPFMPIETVNLRGLRVKALRVGANNIPQFLQINPFQSDNEMHRVGRVVWEAKIPLDVGADSVDRPSRHNLDLRPLLKADPSGLYRITVSFDRSQILYDCAAASDASPETEKPREDDFKSEHDEESNWDAIEDYAAGDNSYEQDYNNRDNPCHPGFYRDYYDHSIAASRNLMFTPIGLIAKLAVDKSLQVFATDLITSQPLVGADVEVLNYQQESLGKASTNSSGAAAFDGLESPFLVVARHNGHQSYLRLSLGDALSVSHFDTSGATLQKGLKGKIYGERGVWRPGDAMHLTFVLFDAKSALPQGHPVQLELIDPRGRVVDSATQTQGQGGFYAFRTQTKPDAPTGNYVARVNVGGARFEQPLKVEMVRPNRLKIDLDFKRPLLQVDTPLASKLSVEWLHGAKARFLNASIKAMLKARQTTFPKYADFNFDSPLRNFIGEPIEFWTGTLNESGEAQVSGVLNAGEDAPGMLTASFTTQVTEVGGDASIDELSVPFAPFKTFIGMRTPKGDVARNMLLTDTKHQVDLVAVTPEGNAAGNTTVELSLYKLNWRWWWEKGNENLSDYVGNVEHQALSKGTVDLKQGRGTWTFEIKYPDWGRYLIVARDTRHGHQTGKIVYVDWPNWAGRAQKDSPQGATTLSAVADKQEYSVGETATITIPSAAKGRALVTLESGRRVVHSEWVEATLGQTQHTFKITPEMAPNIYAHIMFVQPHAQTQNDLPMRLYTVLPLKVVDPGTKLQPVIEAPAEFTPESTAEIVVRETKGRPMTYTLAVVDEGLLSLTRFTTPTLWDHFYQREALGVRTWDIYDSIVGAQSGAIDRLLAIGGDESALNRDNVKAERFPPMVRFIGPVTLEKGARQRHVIDIPRYMGAVRVMVVAGDGRAFGSADKTVRVTKPLLVLASLPRFLAPDDAVDMAVTVFANDATVKNVTVRASTTGQARLTHDTHRTLAFTSPGEHTVTFPLKASSQQGEAKIDIVAESGRDKARYTVSLQVQWPTIKVTDVVADTVSQQGDLQRVVTLPGVPGTNEATLEVSMIPPIDLTRHLDYLLEYPHGCVEQTTSGAFPQLFVDKLIDLSPAQKTRIQTNVDGAIAALRRFQNSNGGFAYWPTQAYADDWSSSYVGHFLLEAEKRGYSVHAGVLEQWKNYQRQRANEWTNANQAAQLAQAYRLFTLALAASPELSAMNRLKETASLAPEAMWRLAAAYQLASQPDVAKKMVASIPLTTHVYADPGLTFGSSLRDKAMILETLYLLKDDVRAIPLAQEVARELSSSESWHSTQTLAYALIAMARSMNEQQKAGQLSFAYEWNGSASQHVESTAFIAQRTLALDAKATQGRLRIHNDLKSPLYVRLITRGIPPRDRETDAANGMTLSVVYTLGNNQPLGKQSIVQGSDIIATAEVTNTTEGRTLNDVALTVFSPSGFEIGNSRLNASATTQQSAFTYQDIRDDRVNTYFDLKPGEKRVYRWRYNVSYIGRYYLPMARVEAMYDGTRNARQAGRIIEVVKPGHELASQH